MTTPRKYIKAIATAILFFFVGFCLAMILLMLTTSHTKNTKISIGQTAHLC
jgi:hypothetical protein